LFEGLVLNIARQDLDQLNQLVGKENVQPDLALGLDLENSVPLIGADQVWDMLEVGMKGSSGADVTVAVIDTGVNYNHPDLGGCLGPGCKVVGGYDFIDQDQDPMDDDGHGTSVAGIIAAQHNLGANGVAPDAHLLAYKVCQGTETGPAVCYESAVIAAIQQAVRDQADIINLSLGRIGTTDCFLCETVDAAVSAGVLVVASAGNSGDFGMVNVPGLCRLAIAVGATSTPDEIAGFSSRGILVANPESNKPELVAPGTLIHSPTWTASSTAAGEYSKFSGTSAAAPHVTGAAALLLELHPDWTPTMLRAALIGSAIRLPWYSAAEQGAGRLSVIKAAQLPVLMFASRPGFGLVQGANLPIQLEVVGLGSQAVGVTISHQVTWVARDAEHPADFPVRMPAAYAQVDQTEVLVAPGEVSTVQVTVSVPLDAPSGYYELWLDVAVTGAGTSHLPLNFWVDHGETPDPDPYAIPVDARVIFVPLAVH
jgi:subtilisin family serine protease